MNLGLRHILPYSTTHILCYYWWILQGDDSVFTQKPKLSNDDTRFSYKLLFLDLTDAKFNANESLT